MVGADHSILGAGVRPLHDGKQVALDTFPADIGSLPRFPSGDLVDLIYKNDSRFFHPLDGLFRDRVGVDELFLLLPEQMLAGLRERHATLAAFGAGETWH